jgi:hypothetical protein
MPIIPSMPNFQSIGRKANTLFTSLLAMLVPIVPITHLLNVVVMSNKGIMGMHKHVYARKSFKCLGMDMGTRRFLCARN